MWSKGNYNNMVSLIFFFSPLEPKISNTLYNSYIKKKKEGYSTCLVGF